MGIVEKAMEKRGVCFVDGSYPQKNWHSEEFNPHFIHGNFVGFLGTYDLFQLIQSPTTTNYIYIYSSSLKRGF
jgi:hypothetical protein